MRTGRRRIAGLKIDHALAAQFGEVIVKGEHPNLTALEQRIFEFWGAVLILDQILNAQGSTQDLERGDTALTIGARQGSFPGMVKARELNLVVMPAAPGGTSVNRTVRYAGKAATVRF